MCNLACTFDFRQANSQHFTLKSWIFYQPFQTSRPHHNTALLACEGELRLKLEEDLFFMFFIAMKLKER